MPVNRNFAACQPGAPGSCPCRQRTGGRRWQEVWPRSAMVRAGAREAVRSIQEQQEDES